MAYSYHDSSRHSFHVRLMVVSFGVSGGDGAMNVRSRHRNRSDGGDNGVDDQAGVELEKSCHCWYESSQSQAIVLDLVMEIRPTKWSTCMLMVSKHTNILLPQVVLICIVVSTLIQTKQSKSDCLHHPITKYNGRKCCFPCFVHVTLHMNYDIFIFPPACLSISQCK